MKLKSLAFVLAFAAPMIASGNPNDDKKATTNDDKKPAKLAEVEIQILAHVHHVNQMEIDMGKLATNRGTAAVKRYGEMLVRDHSTSDKEVVAFAKRRGIAKIPAEKLSTDAEKQELKQTMEAMANLKKLKGADFDREYLQMMVEGHDKELARSDNSISIATDAELKTMLENRKTTLQRHADGARELQKGNAAVSAAPAK